MSDLPAGTVVLAFARVSPRGSDAAWEGNLDAVFSICFGDCVFGLADWHSGCQALRAGAVRDDLKALNSQVQQLRQAGKFQEAIAVAYRYVAAAKKNPLPR
jgi:hypothetical protein